MGKLVGFITGYVQTIFIDKAVGQIPTLGWWCIHRSLRGLGLGKLLLGAIEAQAHQVGCKQWMTFNQQKPTERLILNGNQFNTHLMMSIFLNSKKLAKWGLPGKIEIFKPEGEEYLQTLKKKHYKSAISVLIKYLSKYAIKPTWNEDEFLLRFAPRKGVIYSYVMEDLNGEVTEFISFTLRHVRNVSKDNERDARDNILNVAQLDYYVNNRMSLTELVSQGIAKLKGVDQVIIPQIMDYSNINIKMSVSSIKSIWCYNGKIKSTDTHEMSLVSLF